MGTPLTDVYNFFLSKVKNYSFITLNTQGKLESVLFSYLTGAVVRFTNCNTPLDINSVVGEFTNELTVEEKEILSTIMLLNYITGKIMSDENLDQILSERDYAMRSQANHLSQLISLKSQIQSEVSQLLNSYSLRLGLKDFD